MTVKRYAWDGPVPRGAGCVDFKAKTAFEKLLQGPRDKIRSLSNQRKDNRPVNSSLWPPYSLCMMSRDAHILFLVLICAGDSFIVCFYYNCYDDYHYHYGYHHRW